MHRVQGKELDLRVSTVPTSHGESVVMRILDRESIVLDFDSLGFDEGLKEILCQGAGNAAWHYPGHGPHRFG